MITTRYDTTTSSRGWLAIHHPTRPNNYWTKAMQTPRLGAPRTSPHQAHSRSSAEAKRREDILSDSNIIILFSCSIGKGCMCIRRHVRLQLGQLFRVSRFLKDSCIAQRWIERALSSVERRRSSLFNPVFASETSCNGRSAILIDR